MVGMGVQPLGMGGMSGIGGTGGMGSMVRT